MSKKKTLIILFSIVLLFLFTQKCFAKYTLSEYANLSVYIDKTPPIINIVSKNVNETYKSSDLVNVIKNNSEVTINISDNIKIKNNEVCYNPNENNFNGIIPTEFKTGDVFNEDGYYKITAIDTSNNVTEIIILIDKTPPEVKVEFYKKGEKTSKTEVVKVAGVKNYKSATNVIDQVEDNIDNNEEIEEIEVVEKNITLRMATYAGTANVYNESDFRNAINNKYSNIVVWNSINFSSPIYINYNVTIRPATNNNALRYSGYNNFFIVQSGGTLNVTAMVIDTNGLAKNHNTTAINIQNRW